MRITLVLSAFAPVEGGTERQLRLVFSKLVALGDAITVVTLAQPNCPKVELIGGMTVIRCPVSMQRKTGRFTEALRMAIGVARTRPDVIVSSQLGASTISALLVGSLKRVPFIIRLAGGSLSGSEAHVRSGSALQRKVLPWLASRAAAVVSPAAHLLQGTDPISISLQSNSVVIPNGTPSGRNQQSRDGQLNIDVVWVGRNDPVKGVTDLLAVARRCSDLNFVALGIEPMQQTPDNLKCAGAVADTAEYLQKATVLLSTSRFEGSPNAVLEAFAVGVPAIGYATAALCELKEGYGAAITLVPLGDLDALELTVRAIVKSPPIVEKKPPTIDDVAASWRDLFDRACP